MKVNMDDVLDSPIPINDRIPGADRRAIVGRTMIAASPQIPDEPSFHAHRVSQRFFISEASVARDAFNGTASGFYGISDNISPFGVRCTAN